MTDRSTPEAAESWEGQILDGRYRVGELLGTGSFGRVYEGHHTSLAQRVAIKVFRSDVVVLAGGPDRVLVDARAASRIRHRHVVDVHDIGRLADTVYVVTELVLGRTLHAFLVQAGRLPWSRARGVALQIAAALEAAHEAGVLHRGLRAANCFVLEDLAPTAAGEPRLKVSDFAFTLPGLAGGGRGEEHTSPFVGDAAYTAPELAKGGAASVQSDIYAFGVLLHRTLVGALPFEGGTPYQVLAAHVERPVPSLRERVRSISAEVEAIVLRALAKDPSERFGSMRELAEALAQAVGEADEAAPSAALDELVMRQHGQAPAPAAPEHDEDMHAAFEQRQDEAGELPTSMFDRRVPYFGPTDASAAWPEPTIQLGFAMLEKHALELPSVVASGMPQLMPGVRQVQSSFPHLMSSVQYVPSHDGGASEPTMFLDGAASSPTPDPTMLLGGGVQSPIPSHLGGQRETDDDFVDGPTLHHPIRSVPPATEHLAPPLAGRRSMALDAPSPAVPFGSPMSAYAAGPIVPHASTPAALHGAPVVAHAPVLAAVAVHAAAPTIGHAPARGPVTAHSSAARLAGPAPRLLPQHHPSASVSSTTAAINVLIIMIALVIAGTLVLLALTCPSRRSAGERASSLRLPLGDTRIGTAMVGADVPGPCM